MTREDTRDSMSFLFPPCLLDALPMITRGEIYVP